MRISLGVGIVLVGIAVADADVIRVKGGGTIEGSILRESATEVVIASNYRTLVYNKEYLTAVERTKRDEAPTDKPPRLAAWRTCLEKVAARAWAGDLHQIPATVIDKGILKYVPYMSHKSWNYEFNIYGDPDSPACLEVGMYKDLLKDPDAKHECRMLMATLLGDPKDAAALRSLNLDKDKKERDGLTFEVTPETDEDAYGGWWISIYFEKQLDTQRATEKELAAITVKQEPANGELKPVKQQGGLAKPPTEEELARWTPGEFREARLRKDQPTGSGLVYVRGYYRRDGTYVHPYTRHAPRR